MRLEPDVVAALGTAPAVTSPPPAPALNPDSSTSDVAGLGVSVGA
jgi:hypothetical protein